MEVITEVTTEGTTDIMEGTTDIMEGTMAVGMAIMGGVEAITDGVVIAVGAGEAVGAAQWELIGATDSTAALSTNILARGLARGQIPGIIPGYLSLNILGYI